MKPRTPEGMVKLGRVRNLDFVCTEDEYREMVPEPFDLDQMVSFTLRGKVVPAPSAKGQVAVQVHNKTYYLDPEQVTS
jgi:hypothetical protein